MKAIIVFGLVAMLLVAHKPAETGPKAIPNPPNCETDPPTWKGYPVWQDGQWACLFVPTGQKQKIFFSTPPKTK